MNLKGQTVCRISLRTSQSSREIAAGFKHNTSRLSAQMLAPVKIFPQSDFSLQLSRLELSIGFWVTSPYRSTLKEHSVALSETGITLQRPVSQFYMFMDYLHTDCRSYFKNSFGQASDFAAEKSRCFLICYVLINVTILG